MFCAEWPIQGLQKWGLWIQSEFLQPAHCTSSWAFSSSQGMGLLVWLLCFLSRVPHLKIVLAISTCPVPPFFKAHEHHFLPPFLPPPSFLHHPQTSTTLSTHMLGIYTVGNHHGSTACRHFSRHGWEKSPKEGNPCSNGACICPVLTNLLFFSLQVFCPSIPVITVCLE